MKEQEILHQMYLVAWEKNVWMLKKWGAKKIFSAAGSPGKKYTTARPLGVYSEPEIYFRCGFWPHVNELKRGDIY